MGALAAAVNKQGEDAVADVIEMLKEMRHRGADSVSLTTPNLTVESSSAFEIEAKKLVSNMAAGQNHSSNMRGKRQLPDSLRKHGCQLLFDGELFPPTQSLDGSYVLAQVFSDRIAAGRDMFGTAPLYYGENAALCAVASERKALWKIGIKEAHSLPPEKLATMTAEGFAFNCRDYFTFKSISQRRMRIEKAASHLQELLLKSIKERLVDVKEAAVAFSGGLDSTVLAALAKSCISKLTLITVGLENQPELQNARKAAETLDLPLKLRTYRVADVERVLEKVLWLIEEPDVMKAGVAIPFFWTAETASKTGCHMLLAGQGADELFGGYHRYLGEYRREGAEAVQKTMLNDLMRAHEVNFQRDEPVCTFHGEELRLPYVDYQVVHFALNLPLNMKIDSPRDSLRKKVLRQVASNLGLPDSLANRPKKAVQYATGVDKALRVLAREKGLTQQSYIKQVFEKVYPEWKDEA